MEAQLQAIGLTEAQAKVYLHLLQHADGRKPAQIAKQLNLTRTNCYKILEQLTSYDLVRSSEEAKTLTFFAEDPIALTSFVAKARNHALELEKSVKASMSTLQARYRSKRPHAEVAATYGKTAIAKAYRDQANGKDDIYFIKTRADIPFMGYDAMVAIRTLPSTRGQHRYGITPDVPEAPTHDRHDQKTNLTRTWVAQEAYQSPIEWTVAGDELNIINFSDTGSTIRIKDETIASAFREIWKLLDASLRESPHYAALPYHAERKD